MAVPATALHLSDDDIIGACVRRLEHEGAEVTSRSGRSLQFIVRFGARGQPWLARKLTDDLTHGAFELIEEPGHRRRVRYDLSHARGTMIAIVLFTAVLAISVASSGNWPPWWVLPLMVLLAYLAGQLTLAMGAPYWIRRAISDAVRARQ